MLPQLKRLTDLFVEGETLDLGDDETGTPALIWVNKLNSFQMEEARLDGATARADRLMELDDPTSTESQRIKAELKGKDVDALVQLIFIHEQNDLLGRALTETQSIEKAHEDSEFVRRQTKLLDDGDVPADDPRRKRLEDKESAYVQHFQTTLERVKKERTQELKNFTLDELKERVLASWRDNNSMDRFMIQRKITQMYYAMRVCAATRTPGGTYDHSGCDHQKYLLDDRKEALTLPQGLQDKIIEVLDRIEVGATESGNSDVPATSSESSEQQSAQEESKPSTPAATSTDAPST